MELRYVFYLYRYRLFVRFENRVGHVAVSNDLNRAIVIVELLGRNNIRCVAMNVTIDADNVLHHAGDRTQVVRHHHDSDTLVQLFQQFI